MSEWENRFVCLIRDSNDNLINVVNIVGCSFAEVEEEANRRENLTGCKCTIIRDKTLFEVVQLLKSEQIDIIKQLVDIRDEITDIIKKG